MIRKRHTEGHQGPKLQSWFIACFFLLQRSVRHTLSSQDAADITVCLMCISQCDVSWVKSIKLRAVEAVRDLAGVPNATPVATTIVQILLIVS